MAAFSDPGFKRFTARSAGEKVYEVLNGPHQASVIGVTSRGVFITNPARQMVFLSLEPFCGPLTITLSDPPPDFSFIPANSSVDVYPQALAFPAVKTAVSIPIDAAWHPPPLVGFLQTGYRRHMAQVMDSILVVKPFTGLAPLLPHILNSPISSPLPEELANLLPAIDGSRLAAKAGDLPALLTNLCYLLGRGRGLTPSGDDFVVGFLLAVNRWQVSLKVDLDLLTLNASLLAAASTRTTTLSANLIERAGFGCADERLLALLDGLVTGAISPQSCADLALSLGNSSGIDTLAGMALALI